MSDKTEQQIDKWEIRAEAQERRAEEATAAQIAMHSAIARASSLDAEGKRIMLDNSAEDVAARRLSEARSAESHESYLDEVRHNKDIGRRNAESWERIAAALEALAAKK